MEFRRLSPQKVVHSLGYIVQVYDRTTVEYFDQDTRALVEVDFGSSVGIYIKSIRVFNDSQKTFNSREKRLILDRIAAGLEEMGCTTIEV